MNLRIIKSDDGFRVWRGNTCIAVTDENGLLFDISSGEAQRLDYVDNEREIRSLLTEHGLA